MNDLKFTVEQLEKSKELVNKKQMKIEELEKQITDLRLALRIAAKALELLEDDSQFEEINMTDEELQEIEYMLDGKSLLSDEEVFHWLKIDTRKLLEEVRRLGNQQNLTLKLFDNSEKVE